MGNKKELEVAVSAAKKAGKILLGRMGKTRVSEIKGKADMSTDADIESEKAIIGFIESAFPKHSIIGEETGKKDKGSESTWIIDPLDGTKNYFKRIPIFSVSIALAREKEIVLGVVFDPVAKMLYHAERGKGCFLNGERIRVSKTRSLDRATVFFDSGNLGKANPESLRKMGEKIYRVRNFGVGSLALCYLAQGAYDAYVGNPNVKIMDIAAGTLIAGEAGAKVTGLKGETANLFESRALVASNGLLHKGLLEIFG